MEVENKLKAMGLELPAAGVPPPGRAGAVKIGNILFVGGHTPGPAYRGKLGAGFTVEQGYDGARQACLNCLADVKAVIGDLDKVKRVAKLLCMVNSAPDFGSKAASHLGDATILLHFVCHGLNWYKFLPIIRFQGSRSTVYLLIIIGGKRSIYVRKFLGFRKFSSYGSIGISIYVVKNLASHIHTVKKSKSKISSSWKRCPTTFGKIEMKFGIRKRV
jgi:enamine deaminase RidA (YjgF/YER057c/UK114 family)